MANPNLSTNNTTQFNEMIKKEFLANFRSDLVLAPLGMDSTHPLNQGETARWLKVDDLDADPANAVLTEGTTPAGQALVDSQVEATLVQYGRYVEIADKYKNIAVPDIVSKVGNIIARQAANVVDRLVRNELNSTTNNDFASPGTNASIANVQTNQTELSSSDLKRMVTALRNANVPAFADGLYAGILHPFMERALLNETGTSDYIVLASNNTTGGSAIDEAEIGKAFGLRLRRTTEVQADSVSTDVYENIFLGKDVFGTHTLQNNDVQIITKPFGDGEDPLNQRMTIGWKMMYATKILQTAGVRSLHAYGA